MKTRWLMVLCLACLPGLLLLPGQACAQDSDDAEPPGLPSVGGAAGLPSPAGRDSIRTNIWLSEALMAEVVQVAAAALPAPPAAVLLLDKSSGAYADVFVGPASHVLRELGYEIYLPDDDPARQAAVDYEFSFDVRDVDLAYPDVGRTLGVWRQWVARDLSLTALVEITEADSGRLLLSDRITRRFSDRVPADDFDAVNSDLYGFTTAETGESGWQRRLEEIVVLATLTGLVAVYFANTSN